MSFVSSDFKQVLHAVRNVARTDLIHHTLNPSEKTIERRLQSIWARTWNDTFSDVDTAKAFVSSELEGIHLNVYIHYSKDLGSIDTLDKIKTLARASFNKADKAVQDICKKPLPTHATEVKGNLRAIWKDAQNNLQYVSLELAKEGLKTALENAVVPQNIKNIYLEDIHLAQTIEGLQNRLQSYLNDLEVKGAGITSTSLGSQGYPKIIDVQRGERILGFMKTLGSSLEMDYHLLYSFFLNDCLAGEDLHIQVPKASMFDIAKAQYVDSSGKKHDISKYNEQIKHLLGSVASLNTNATKKNADVEIEFQNIIQTCPAGFFELVSGLNLADFFKEKYLSLDVDQKDRFWASLGLITYLDLILGNGDRLIKLLPDVDTKAYSFLSSDENPIEKSNLGNLMISHNLAELYTIDNGIGDGERKSAVDIQKKLNDEQAYTAFLEHNLGKEDFEAVACDYLIKSVTLSIKDAFQDTDYDENSLGAVLSDVSLETHIASLDRGMKEMSTLLTTIILPKWNLADTDTIKKELDADFVQTIQTRLDLFAKLKSKPIAIQIDSESDEDMLMELNAFGNSSDEWGSPIRGVSSEVRDTPFSPVMTHSKNIALQNIASRLKELSVATASEDSRSLVAARLNSLENDFLLPQDIQRKIAEVQPLLSDSTSNKDVLAALIEDLAESLLAINPLTISPRASRQQSWDYRDDPAKFSGSASFSLFDKTIA